MRHPSAEASFSATALRAAPVFRLGSVKKPAPVVWRKNATDQRIVNQIGNHLLLWHVRDGGVAEAFRYPNHGVHRLKGTSSSV